MVSVGLGDGKAVAQLAIGGVGDEEEQGDGGGAECVAERRCGLPHAGGEEQGTEAVGNVEKDEGEE